MKKIFLFCTLTASYASITAMDCEQYKKQLRAHEIKYKEELKKLDPNDGVLQHNFRKNHLEREHRGIEKHLQRDYQHCIAHHMNAQ